MALSHEDDPDSQMPLPFAAANEYAAQVMRWSRQLPLQDLRVWRNLQYASHALQHCDVFAPFNQSGAPILVFWHGGGWTNGYPAYAHFMAQAVCSRGWVLVCPGYRLAPQHRFPAAMEDACRALEFVHAHAQEWGADPQRMAIAGHSAGGHLAVMAAALTQTHSHANSHAILPNCAVPARAIRACMPVSGIMDLRHSAPAPGSLEMRVYELLLQKPEHDALVSPVSWSQALAASAIPIDLSWGEQDSERVKSSNLALSTILQEQLVRVKTDIQPSSNHFQTHTALRAPQHDWFERLQEYFLAR